MKKIIMYTCIISLTFGAGTDVLAAPTLNEVVSGALNATIDNLRANNTGMELTTSQSLTYTSDYYSPTGTSANKIMSYVSNMRAQAEMYYSENNSYGIKTQSCGAGMFANTTTGLGSLMKSLRTESKEISCISSNTAFAVSAKIKTGEYWCVDSAGNSKGITKILKKGSTSCDAGVKLKAKPVTKTYGTIMSVFPSTNGIDFKISPIGESSSLTVFTLAYKSGVSYFMATKEIDSEIAYKNRGLYVGRFVEMPVGSYVNEYLGFPNNVNTFLSTLLQASTVSLVRTNADKSSVYQVSVPYSQIGGMSYYAKGNARVTVLVTIKNGLIQSVTSNSVVATDSQTKLVFTVKTKIIPNTLNAQLQGKTVSCVDYFDQDEYCSADAMKTSLEDARNKGESAATMSILSNMRAQAELYYANNNSYGPTARSCSEGIFASKDVGGLSYLVSAAKEKSPNYMYCAADTNAWVVSATVPTGGYYCVDSTGTAKVTSLRNENGDYACR